MRDVEDSLVLAALAHRVARESGRPATLEQLQADLPDVDERQIHSVLAQLVQERRALRAGEGWTVPGAPQWAAGLAEGPPRRYF